MLKICRTAKRAKLLQYGQRVWNLNNPDEEKLIDEAIVKTTEFFQKMLVPTSLSEVDLGKNDIDKIMLKLEQHGMVALGENADVTPDVSRKILEAAL